MKTVYTIKFPTSFDVIPLSNADDFLQKDNAIFHYQ